MLEREKIQYRGFRNVYDEAGNAVGVEFRIRTTYYRGCWLSQIRHGRVIVDGQEFWPDSGEVTWIMQGKEYTIAEIEQANEIMWPMTEAATLRVQLPGGLKTAKIEFMNLKEEEDGKTISGEGKISVLPGRTLTGAFTFEENTFVGEIKAPVVGKIRITEGHRV